MTAIETMPTEQLVKLCEQAERAGDWPRCERIEAELERRDYDASDDSAQTNPS